jgi:sporulation protein YlmC with PRC-barrel domain
MRLSDLLGSEVFASDGQKLGTVHDVRLVQDGPLLGDAGAAFRVHDLVVGRGSIGSRLGYDRGHREVKGPLLLRLIFGARSPREIPWSAIREIAEKRIVADVEA